MQTRQRRTMNTYSKRDINVLRKKLELSQEGLARELGVSFSTVNRWESGKSHLSQLEGISINNLYKKSEATANDRNSKLLHADRHE